MHSTFGDCDNFLACGQALRAVAIYYGFLRRLFAMLTPDVSGFFGGLPCLQLVRLFALLGSMRGWHRRGFWVPSFGRRPPTRIAEGERQRAAAAAAAFAALAALAAAAAAAAAVAAAASA